MSKIPDYEEYPGKRVEILYSNKSAYKNVIHMIGTVEMTRRGDIGVLIDGMENSVSSYGVFWFLRSEIKIMEDEKMEGFKNVAIVNLLDDYSKKDYGFALYDSELELFKNTPVGQAMVVVNARGRDNRQIGIVKQLMTAEEYGKGVSAQIVGVVNMAGFNAREDEIKRKAETKKQKDKIEKEFKERLDKLKDAEYYARMAKEYADKDPELVKLVNQLKELGD